MNRKNVLRCAQTICLSVFLITLTACSSASATETKTGTIDADTCRTERAKASELSRQLRSTLEVYGRESNRADENTRALNLCITDLAAKKNYLNRTDRLLYKYCSLSL